MLKHLTLTVAALAAMTLPAAAQQQPDSLLTGHIIGTYLAFDYETGQKSDTVNTFVNAFDGDLDTFFATNAHHMTWCGLDLGTPHVITRVGWAPRNDPDSGAVRVQLAVFEGANQRDFSDAVPLHLNRNVGTLGQMDYAPVSVSRAFRYVRYVGPDSAHCNVAEVEFYGHEAEGSDSALYRPSQLPLVVIECEDFREPWGKHKADEVDCHVTLIPADPTQDVTTAQATVRLRGNSSIAFPKKPYRIKFDKKQRVFDSPAKAKKWTLINNWGDKTLMRNSIAYEISRRMGMEYVPYCQPVDVIFNGEYKGCYQLCDQIEVDKNRVNVEEMDTTMNSEPEITGGYLIEVDGYAFQEDSYFYSNDSTPVTIKYPDSDDITPQQAAYIAGIFNLLEHKMFSDGFSADDGYRQYLDLDAFLRRFLTGAFTANSDDYSSVYFYKRRGNDQLVACPVWDFDLALDNNSETHHLLDSDEWPYNYGHNVGQMQQFVHRIAHWDQRAKQQMAQLWADLRQAGFNAANLTAHLDSLAQQMSESASLNFMRWPILDELVHNNFQALGSWQAEVDYLRDFIKRRFWWMDAMLGYDSGVDDTLAQPAASTDKRIFTIDGRCVGTDATALPHGLYIQGGRKFVVK